MDSDLIRQAAQVARRELDSRLAYPWAEGPTLVALATWDGRELVISHEEPWASEMAVLAPGQPVRKTALAVAEGFCPAHLVMLTGEGRPLPCCPQCRAFWTVSRLVRNVVFLDRPGKRMTWHRLALLPLPAGHAPGA